jgi:hypothetical protein
LYVSLPKQGNTKTMTQTSPIPLADEALRAYALNAASVAADAPATYGLTEAQAADLTAKAAAYDAALSVALAPATATTPARAAKNTAKGEFLAAWRPLQILISRNATISDQNKRDIGALVPSPSRTPILPPASAPHIRVGVSTPGVQDFHVSESAGATSRGKPPGVTSIEIAVAPAAAAATDPATWPLRTATSRPVFTARADAMPAGADLVIAARYSTGKANIDGSNYSPWSPAFSFRRP